MARQARPPWNCHNCGGIVNIHASKVPSPQPHKPVMTDQVFVNWIYYTLSVPKQSGKYLYPYELFFFSFFLSPPSSFFVFFFTSEPLSWLHCEADKNPIQALRNSRCQPQRKPKASSAQVHPDAPFNCPYCQGVCGAKKIPYFQKALQSIDLASTPGPVYW